jgi:hypothetical protein
MCTFPFLLRKNNCECWWEKEQKPFFSPMSCHKLSSICEKAKWKKYTRIEDCFRRFWNCGLPSNCLKWLIGERLENFAAAAAGQNIKMCGQKWSNFQWICHYFWYELFVLVLSLSPIFSSKFVSILVQFFSNSPALSFYTIWARYPKGLAKRSSMWILKRTSYNKIDSFLNGTDDAPKTASWQGCQMVYFRTKNHSLGKFWSVLQRKVLVNFLPIWSISLPFEIFYWH